MKLIMYFPLLCVSISTLLFLFLFCTLEIRSKTYKFEIVIYGGTPAGLFAAIQCVRMNKTVAVVTPERTIGGLTSSGLGWTDSKNGEAIGGIAREFYGKIYT
jgi:NADPH-dependent 2,4-dienoyl-CoA reductase/sulfur reductase-like enzyme